MGRGEKKASKPVLSLETNEVLKDYWLCQSNDLIEGIQTLKINSAKIIRAVITQISKDDQEFKPYVISVKALSELLEVDVANLYRDMDNITDDINRNPVHIKKTINGKEGFIKIPWVSYCGYHPDIGLVIKLNDQLKEYLLNLAGHFTRYILADILTLKSVYAIRIYELLLIRVYRYLPRQGRDIELSLDVIKQACGCDNECYNIFSNFKKRVLDIAIREINNKTPYIIREPIGYIKNGKKIVGIRFHMNTYINEKLLEIEQREREH